MVLQAGLVAKQGQTKANPGDLNPQSFSAPQKGNLGRFYVAEFITEEYKITFLLISKDIAKISRYLTKRSFPNDLAQHLLDLDTLVKKLKQRKWI